MSSFLCKRDMSLLSVIPRALWWSASVFPAAVVVKAIALPNKKWKSIRQSASTIRRMCASHCTSKVLTFRGCINISPCLFPWAMRTTIRYLEFPRACGMVSDYSICHVLCGGSMLSCSSLLCSRLVSDLTHARFDGLNYPAAFPLCRPNIAFHVEKTL